MAEQPYQFFEAGKTQADGNIELRQQDAEIYVRDRFNHQFTIRGTSGTVELWGKFQGMKEAEGEEQLGFEPILDSFGTPVVVDLSVPQSFIVYGAFQAFKLVPVAVVGTYDYSVIGW